MRRALRCTAVAAVAALAGWQAFRVADRPNWSADGTTGLRFAALDNAADRVWLLERVELDVVAHEHDLRNGRRLSSHLLPVGRFAQLAGTHGSLALFTASADDLPLTTRFTLWDFSRRQAVGNWAKLGRGRKTAELAANGTRVVADVMFGAPSQLGYQLLDARDGRVIRKWPLGKDWQNRRIDDWSLNPTGERVALIVPAPADQPRSFHRLVVANAADGRELASELASDAYYSPPQWLGPREVAFSGLPSSPPQINKLDVESGATTTLKEWPNQRAVETPQGPINRVYRVLAAPAGLRWEEGPRDRTFIDEAAARLRGIGLDTVARWMDPVLERWNRHCSIVRTADGTPLRAFVWPCALGALSADGKVAICGGQMGGSFGVIEAWPVRPSPLRWLWAVLASGTVVAFDAATAARAARRRRPAP